MVVDAAWSVSTFADLELPHVGGPYPRGYRLIRWLRGQVFRTSTTDAVTDERPGRVTAVLAHPGEPADPGTVPRVDLRSAAGARPDDPAPAPAQRRS
ncbi:hypothetical protein [Actinosynnema sp. NPDC020468]|uniref:hypothetical protein n=1 Tax=Actinosynnema sp. NPDC020468 TaxID=3154488 RepID=UPI0033CC9FB8